MKGIDQGGLGLREPLEYIGVPYTNGGQIELLDYLATS